MICGKRWRSQFWFSFVFSSPLFLVLFSCDGGGQHVCFFSFLCTASTLYSDKKHLFSPVKTQCWAQNTERALLVEANMTVRLPRKPCIAVRISSCFVADCGSWCVSFKTESNLGGHLWSRLPLLCLIIKGRWSLKTSPKTMFQKSHEGQK